MPHAHAVMRRAVASLDREVMAGFGVGVSYIWRRYSNLSTTFRDGVSSSSYSPVSFSRPCGNDLCDQPSYTGTYYQRAAPLPAATVRAPAETISPPSSSAFTLG